MTSTAPADTRLSRYAAFLKGEPKALGTVQIMIGCVTFLFGIVLIPTDPRSGIIGGIALCGSLIYISSGALSVAAANQLKSCLVKASLGMNVFSSVVAGFSFILFAMNMAIGFDRYFWCHRHENGYETCDYRAQSMLNGINGVLLVFSLLELIISICTSAFACNATCCSQPIVMYSAPVGSQPMYNPAFYNPQVQTDSVYQCPDTYNNV